MALDQLPQFMASIRRLESGSFDGNYQAVGPTVRTGQYAGDNAYGAYQIMQRNWDSWAAEAGYAGADIRDPAAQDAVARYKFEQLYNKYGSWDLVAIAWFAGESRAQKAARRGVDSLSGVADVTGTDVPQYVSTIRQYMSQQGVQPSDSTTAAARRVYEGEGAQPTAGGMTPETTEVPKPEKQPKTTAQKLAMQSVKMLSKLARQNPGQGPEISDTLNQTFGLEAR